ncbi:hypothetical protein M947_06425 [Sulfurimonas hongkongensis]|uniref:Single-stranded DNA-binding protein n=1 Tax=Sulfurimonas hongkongensis TaxID=1172190 RepID=T0JF21_9BACT|nr:hypothetical protein [Sulfurimonas hongkongensis]EQB39625.1 hypothetical protein M947_06425 [Sulfurimonas hongkongensis]
MTAHFIGRLLEVRPVETKDNKTDKIKYSTELTVMFEGITEDGYLKPSVESIYADEEDYDVFKDKKGSYVAIPYNLSVNQWGQKYYYDKAMPVLELANNPLDYSKFDRSKVKKSS